MNLQGLIKLRSNWTFLVTLVSVGLQTLETSVSSVEVCLALRT